MINGHKTYTATDFIATTQHGELDLEKSERVVEDLAAAASYHRDHNVLLDLRETDSRLDFMDLLNLSTRFVQYKDIFQNKMAVVIPNLKERIEKAEFFAAGLGLVGCEMKHFTDYETAVRWMSKEKEYP
jgi:hypothetical protein